MTQTPAADWLADHQWCTREWGFCDNGKRWQPGDPKIPKGACMLGAIAHVHNWTIEQANIKSVEIAKFMGLQVPEGAEACAAITEWNDAQTSKELVLSMLRDIEENLYA